jgi:hypothetical protein
MQRFSAWLSQWNVKSQCPALQFWGTIQRELCEATLVPLPKPLAKGASKSKKKKVVAATMHDLKKGPHHKDRTHAQEVAIALKQSGQSKKKKSNGKK